MVLEFTYSDNTYTVIDGILNGQAASGQFPTIPATVTSIDGGAFQNCYSLSGSVTIPSTVTSIGDYAFAGCTGLTGLTLSASVTSISDSTFRGCSGLTGSVTIPSTVTSIGPSAFSGCSKLTGLTLPASLTTISAFVFQECSGLTGALTIPASVTSIGAGAFAGCSGLTRIYYFSTNNATVMGGKIDNINATQVYTDNTFYYLDSLKTTIVGIVNSVGQFPTIPSTVRSIGAGAFSGCSGLTGRVTIPSTVGGIGAGAFTGCTGLTRIYYFSTAGIDGSSGRIDGIDAIKVYTDNTFYYSDLLKTTIVGIVNSVGTFPTIPSTVTTIGRIAFYNCSELTGTFIIPSSVTTIESSAFDSCSGLNGALTIPITVRSIGEYAFLRCSGLTITYYTTTSIGSDALLYVLNIISIATDGTFIYDNDQYKTNIIGLLAGTSATGQFPTIPPTVASIEASAFQGCSGLTGSVTIPITVTSIGAGAFAGCSGLTRIYYFSTNNATVTGGKIDNINATQVYTDNTFYYSDSLKTTIVGIVNSVGQFPTIPSTVRSIGAGAFSGCSRLTGSVTIPASVTSIGASTFSGCSGLTGLSLPASVTSIGASAFQGCSGLTGSVTLPASVTSIGAGAFSGCSGLTGNVTIPITVTSIGVGAFSGCSRLTRIYYFSTNNATVTNGRIDGINATQVYTDNTFYYSDSLKTALTGIVNSVGQFPTIPSTVTSIGVGAFSGCSRLTGSVTIPSTVRSIGASAFQGCSGLTGNVIIPSTVRSIGAGAFSGCSGLTRIYYFLTNNATVTNGRIDGINATQVYTDNTFYYSDSLKTALIGIVGGTNATGALTIPITVTSVATRALAGCTKLTSITYYSTTTIGTDAFSGVPRKNILYTDRTFLYSSSSKTTITGIIGGTNATGALTILITVTSVAANAFKGCTKLTSITYYSTTTIGKDAFSGVKNVITLYTDRTFLYSSSSKTALTGIVGGTNATGALTIPLNIISITANAFKGCTKLTSITYYSTTSVDPSSFTGVPSVITIYTDGKLLYSDNSKTRLTGIIGGTNATGQFPTIPSSVTSIGEGAFSGCTGLTGTFIIPSSVTTIEGSAFKDCTGLNGAITIPITVRSIGQYAFLRCSNRLRFTYYTTTSIGESAIEGPTLISIATDGTFIYDNEQYKINIIGVIATTGAFPAIPTTVVTGILENAFKNSKLTSTSLTIPKNVKTVGKSAFAGCTGIKAITYYLSTTVDASSFTGIAKVNTLRAMFGLKRFAMRFPVLKSD